MLSIQFSNEWIAWLKRGGAVDISSLGNGLLVATTAHQIGLSRRIYKNNKCQIHKSPLCHCGMPIAALRGSFDDFGDSSGMETISEPISRRLVATTDELFLKHCETNPVKKIWLMLCMYSVDFSTFGP